MTLNAGIELGDGELYSFITYSNRDNESAAFFRHNGNTGGNAPLEDGDATIPEGFLPKIESEIKRFVTEAHEKATSILKKKKKDWTALAEALLEFETLSGEEIKLLLKDGIKPKRPDAAAKPPVSAVPTTRGGPKPLGDAQPEA